MKVEDLIIGKTYFVTEYEIDGSTWETECFYVGNKGGENFHYFQEVKMPHNIWIVKKNIDKDVRTKEIDYFQ